MQQEYWRRVDEIFHSVLELDVERRAAFLDDTCSGNTPLRLQVERLLAHYDEAVAFLEEPAIQLAARARWIYANHQPVPGEMISHYRVGVKLGSGGMGVVYEAEDLKLDRKVALKFLYEPVKGDDSCAIDRLQAEARATSRLNHPNICTVHAIEEHNGQPVLVMELLEGDSLSQRIKAGALTIHELIGIAVQACDALGASHAKGIVHRDIKPANMFLSNDGRLKLLDFGVAKWMRTSEPDEATGNIAGTIPYMSPEQLRGQEIDGRSDLFSLGAVLYELATGIRPFERSTALLTIQSVLRDSVAPPSSLNPALPSSFDRVIGQMLDKDRDRRYASAAHVSKDLSLVAGSSARTRSKWTLAGVLAGVLAAAAAGAVFWGRHRAPVLTDKDTIVLAEFANKTRDPAFDQTLRPALATQLSQSPFLTLISDERIQHVLQLMAKPPTTPLLAETAREVCERTQSATMLDGEINSSGKQYVIRLRAQNCRTGELLYAQKAQAPRKEDVLPALGQLAEGFRKQAGESLQTIAQHSTPWSEATTPSLEAWRSFTEGTKLMMLQGHAVGIPFMKRAVDIDPHFATALAWLGRAYSALGEMELAREYTRRAFHERDRASDQERFFIDYSYHRLVTGDLEQVLRTCEVWTRSYPRDTNAHALCGAAAKVLGRFDQTAAEEKKTLELDADQPYPYVHLATVAVFRNNYPEALRWLDRASERKLTLPDLPMVRHQIAFLQGDQADMERGGIAAEGMSEVQDWIWGERAQVLAFSGHIKRARAMSQRAVEVALQANRREAAAQHQAAVAVREALFGNLAEALKRAAAAHALSRGKDAQYGAALAFAFSGVLPPAEALTKDLQQRYPRDTVVRFSFVPTLRAIAAIQQGHPGEAVELLRPASGYELGWLGCCSVGFVGSLYPIYVRGQAYLALRQGSEAAAQFQKIVDNRGIVGSNPIALLAHWNKGRALAIAGNNREAKAEYERVLSLWSEADADVPILRVVRAEYDRLQGKVT